MFLVFPTGCVGLLWVGLGCFGLRWVALGCFGLRVVFWLALFNWFVGRFRG